MHQYGTRDVERLLRLSRSTIRALVDAGFVTPARGPKNTLLFSFQDIIVLRTAQALADAKVPAKRITRSLQELRNQLPDSMPLSGLSIGAVGDQVVVRDGSGQRQADTGQYLLSFEGDPGAGSLTVIEPASAPAKPGARKSRSPDEVRGERAPKEDVHELLEEAAALELDDVDGSVRAYERAIAVDAARLDARINLGRLLHESGRMADAEKVYRAAIAAAPHDPLLLYNFGVLLEDTGRRAEAITAYEAALKDDPDFADCCYNLALLYRKEERPRDAIRAMSQYRRLLGAQQE
ncbi:MAG TPA: tetratricopeptide repeat protein [Nevskiaceae bacterium]|nr:tetratricopeptide repeat protein [Nevskiaceae bacterium]